MKNLPSHNAFVIYEDGSGNPVPVSSTNPMPTKRYDQATSSANTPSIASAATALAANTSRKAWMIQNVGTNPLFVLLGSGASATVFHAVLKGGTGANDGTGGSLSQMEGVIYQGIITIAGTAPSYVVLEL